MLSCFAKRPYPDTGYAVITKAKTPMTAHPVSFED